jgi:hypothetical protein
MDQYIPRKEAISVNRRQYTDVLVVARPVFGLTARLLHTDGRKPQAALV